MTINPEQVFDDNYAYLLRGHTGYIFSLLPFPRTSPVPVPHPYLVEEKGAEGKEEGGRERILVSGGNDNTMRSWEEGVGYAKDVLFGHRGRVSCLDWVVPEQTFVSGGWDGTVHIWDCSSDTESPSSKKNISAPFSKVSTVSGLNKDSVCISSSESVTLYEFNIETGQRVAQWGSGGGSIQSVWTSNGCIYYGTSSRTYVTKIDPREAPKDEPIEDKKPSYLSPSKPSYLSPSKPSYLSPSKPSYLSSSSSSPSSSSSLWAPRMTSATPTIGTDDPKKGSGEDPIFEGGITSIIASDSDKWVVVGGSNGRMVRSDLRKWSGNRMCGDSISLKFAGHDKRVTSLQHWEGTLLLVSSGLDGSVRQWDVNTGECRRVFHRIGAQIHTTKLQPHGNTASLFVGCDDFYVTGWVLPYPE